MALQAEIEKLRRKTSYSRGLRRLHAEIKLLEATAANDCEAALPQAQKVVHQAQGLLQRAQARRSHAAPYTEVLAQAHLLLAFVLRLNKDFGEAVIQLDQAVELFTSLDDVVGTLRCQQLEYLILRDQSKIAEAYTVVLQAIPVARAAHEQEIHCELLVYRGVAEQLLQKYEASAKTLQAALKIAQDCDYYLMMIASCKSLGDLAVVANRHKDAVHYLQKALAVSENHSVASVADKNALYWSLLTLQYFLGNYAAVMALEAGHIATLRSAKRTNDNIGVHNFHARLHIRCANYHKALASLQEAILLVDENKISSAAIQSYALLGDLFERCGLPGHAVDYFGICKMHLTQDKSMSANEALDRMGVCYILAHSNYIEGDLPWILDRIDSLIGSHAGLIGLNRLNGLIVARALILERQGKLQEALKEYNSLAAGTEKIGFKSRLLTLVIAQGRTLAKLNQQEAAIPLLRQALQLSRELGATQEEMNVLELLTQQDELSAAEKFSFLQVLRQLEKSTISAELIASLQERAEQITIKRLQASDEKLQEELTELADKLAVSRRLLQSKNAQTEHLNTLLSKVRKLLQQQESENRAESSARIAREIEQTLEQTSWQNFEQEVKQQDDDFLLRLANDYPALSNAERKVCALLRVNHNTKDLCHLLNISPRSVQSHRYRIRKKLGLPSQVDLTTHLLQM